MIFTTFKEQLVTWLVTLNLLPLASLIVILKFTSNDLY